MNGLKKKLIYYYIVLTTVLLIAEGYLYKILFSYAPYLEAKTGISSALFECCGIVLGLALFALISHGYYRIVIRSIKEETQKQVKERNMLFANIAHDLKTPLSSILGFARALEAGAVNADEQQSVYRTICDKSLQVDEMVRKLFQYAKMESDGYTLIRQKTDLCSFLRERVAASYDRIEQNNIELEIDIPKEPLFREVDVAEFSRIIDNLIFNAIRHNDAGTRLLTAIRQENDKVKIIIADSGKEISPAQCCSIFEPFQCSDESRTAKDGSGLGLAIARKSTELHGGRLFIETGIAGYTKGFVVEV